MKKILLILALIATTAATAQVYTGKGDQKFQVGADFQSGSTGVQATYDYGVGENISFGLTAAYALGIDDDISVDFDERAMLRLRFNANIGNVINVDPNLDIYPGLGFSTKNFGGHLGARYFFTDGFGLYTEAAVPFASYKTEDLTPAEDLYNQFTISFGMSFNF
ncbi:MULTISPECIES: DUF6646 family protein [Nonlabens]|uniref:Outer membrane protein beta-barrel domain-containing protein n=1 Tax=Nonlabens ulvanivorans TaxID=906888 RepID=A0A081DG47_NONUL|nr:DUF6646 family protein [Nonlabens ulvanivorans]WOI24050.1 DUF6646 family protein [Nonlabens ulvanivorans]GAK77893.1 hypothetical protein JCM19296_3502 [Nonlabens ulvanivorans]GAL01837.1 hypothetical protein JCM19314_2191 [Nonlabens ulvanivorans]GAL76894.1 hypothetical protein JCM19275_550 [Nonlabens ulvanivorans]